MAGDRVEARQLRAELRQAQRSWDANLPQPAPDQQAPEPASPDDHPQHSSLPVREQVHQALTLLSVPAAPKLIVAVHGAFFAGGLAAAQLTSLRRDEERSFRSSPHARPYYLCAALTADRLAPARGLLAVSTWPLSRRIVGPLSPRVDFLTAAVRVAEQLGRTSQPSLPARRVLWRFAVNVPGAAHTFETMEPEVVARAARAELEIHQDADRAERAAAGARARAQLDDAQQLYGAPLGLTARAAARTRRASKRTSTQRTSTKRTSPDRSVTAEGEEP